jgi:hypothetical protein
MWKKSRPSEEKKILGETEKRIKKWSPRPSEDDAPAETKEANRATPITTPCNMLTIFAER